MFQAMLYISSYFQLHCTRYFESNNHIYSFYIVNNPYSMHTLYAQQSFKRFLKRLLKLYTNCKNRVLLKMETDLHCLEVSFFQIYIATKIKFPIKHVE